MTSTNNLIELELHGLSNSRYVNLFTKLFSKSVTKLYDIILVDKNDRNVAMPVTIGQAESQALGSIMVETTLPLPSTHELFKIVNEKFDCKLDYVVIDKIDTEGVFHSKLVFSKTGEIIEIASRTIDAISLAILHKKSIFVDKTVFEKSCEKY